MPQIYHARGADRPARPAPPILHALSQFQIPLATSFGKPNPS
jgi:hypothetical protein